MESPKSERRNKKADNNTAARLLWCEQYCIVFVFIVALCCLPFFCNNEDTGDSSSRGFVVKPEACVRSFMHGKLSVIVHCYPGVKLEFIVWKGWQLTSKLAAYTSFSAALSLIILSVVQLIKLGCEFCKVCSGKSKILSIMNHVIYNIWCRN